MAPLKQGSRGVWVQRMCREVHRENMGHNVAPPHGILTKKVVVPPTLASGWVISIQQGDWGKGLVLLKTHCVKQGFHYLWDGKGVGRHHMLLGRPISSPPQKSTACCETYKTGKTGTRENHYIL